MLPLVKKWQIVSGYYDLKSHFRSNDHMLFALNLSYAFSSSLLVFSRINIGAKIMIFFLNCRECLRGNDIQNQGDAVGHFCTQSAHGEVWVVRIFPAVQWRTVPPYLQFMSDSCTTHFSRTETCTVTISYQQAWSSHKVTSVHINFSVWIWGLQPMRFQNQYYTPKKFLYESCVNRLHYKKEGSS